MQDKAETMRVLAFPGRAQPLVLERRPIPGPGPEEVLVRISACAVCRTDLHVRDGELPGVGYPIVPGHQAVGTVAAVGQGAALQTGQTVGIPWLAWTCGACEFCRSGRENLCDRAQFHGLHRDGGYADYMLADARFCIPLAADSDPAHTAPLLCAGLIGYRTLRMAGDPRRIGIYGFGSAAHIVTQVARHEGCEVLAFTSPGDIAAQDFARELGCAWAGGSDEESPAVLDAALIFAPVGALVPAALKAVRKGGSVVCGGIHMSDIPSFPYADLWGERSICSVANLTRDDGAQFMAIAARAAIDCRITTYPLERANDALADLEGGRITGTAVLLT
jgi:propanol-preferring alcohol dehydrogenase